MQTDVRVTEVKDIPLESLTIGKAQVRLRDVGKDIDELAESIRKVGLLEPIVVCPAEEAGKFEIITGQRRFLAHREIGAKTILAAILNKRVDETTAKVLSVTENLVRRDLNRNDLVDVCTYLYKKYGSIKAVVDETALSPAKVSEYVKYDRLIPDLKELVDKGEVNLQAALRAQDAATLSKGEFDAAEAVQFAKEMSKMGGAQQKAILIRRRDDPSRPVDEVIEAAKTGEKITQLTVTLSANAHSSLREFAKDKDTSLDDAAASLIEEGLSSKGFLNDE